MRHHDSGLAPAAHNILHVVAVVTDEVFSFLGPATHALAASGGEQTVVMLDELRYRHHLPRLHESAELLLVGRRRNVIAQWHSVLQACIAALNAGTVDAVHLHGLLPCMVGALAVRATRAQVNIFFSPHGSRSLGMLRRLGLSRPAKWLMLPLLRPSRSAVIVSVANESRGFARWKSSEIVESPVSEAFFTVQASPARHPLIVTGGRTQSARGAELLAQLAVLLSGEDLRVSFNWLGTVDKLSRVRLHAAGVGVFDVASDLECAARLASGWIYVAPGGTRGFPLFLVEAMAVGLPCIAFDCPQHREVIDHGVTGYLCKSEREMIDIMATLIDDAALRTVVGRKARKAARERFSEVAFVSKLLAAYADPARTVSAQLP